MSQERLREAGEVLRDASGSVEGDVADRLRTQADAIAELAEKDRGPDHGRVARHQEKLREIKKEAGAVEAEIDRAYALLNEYRETVEGV